MQRKICIFLILLTVAIRGPLLGIPFERDEGEYAYIGWRLDHHELPYKDWMDQKPPAIFWVYHWAFKLPLDPIRAVHLVALLFAAASACALFFLALRFLEQKWAVLAALLFVLFSIDPLLYGTEANTEMFMLLPLILSVLFFFWAASSSRREIILAITAGALIGLSTAFKQVAAVQWPFLVFMFPLFCGRQGPIRRTASFAVYSAVGIAAVWGAICLFFSLRHGFGDFVYSVFTHNLEYVKGLSGSDRLHCLESTLKILAWDEWPVWLFSVVGLAWMLKSRRFRAFLFFVAWWMVSAAGVSASGYYFPHYFQQILPVLCLTTAFGADALDRLAAWKTVSPLLRRAALATVCLAPVAMVLLRITFLYSNAEAVNVIYPGSHFAEKQILAQRLAQVTRPGDKVFIYGAEPEMLFYAQRVSATRYIFLFPLFGPYSDAKARQIATIKEITQNNPSAMVFLPNELFFMPGSEQYFSEWSESYQLQNFDTDSCLAINPAGQSVVVTDIPHQHPDATKGLVFYGTLSVRKTPVSGVR